MTDSWCHLNILFIEIVDPSSGYKSIISRPLGIVLDKVLSTLTLVASIIQHIAWEVIVVPSTVLAYLVRVRGVILGWSNGVHSRSLIDLTLLWLLSLYIVRSSRTTDLSISGYK